MAEDVLEPVVPGPAPVLAGRQRTAADVAYDWMLRRIVALPSDEDMFLTETQVAEAAQVSRTPVREALTRLEGDGMVRRVPRRGALVPPMSRGDVDALFEARGVIEAWATAKAVSARAPLSARLSDVLARQAAVLDDPVAFNSLDVEFHTAIVSAGGNRVFTDVYRSLRHRQMRLGVRAVLRHRERGRDVLAEHRAIAAALARRDERAAVRAARDHLTSTVRALRHDDLRARPTTH
ncbi:GntR family transcriptional regulator [Streptomyces sp. NPDC006367]|uniref:GntR family transcriptional regulator n=1 Tax=unclassified Streptomyces TaxID=2593676 RepID=UPI0033B472D9